ncbi:hypothetical protein GCK72_006994 [Caenorhabditis remanei]|uniref:Uncharacterized protein n=1 Tax=Caenorhabditis remanei TaxID=31234 RepID=A0A6A5HK25_CAERE|nr:hypothetical protein GCK72_006994 [Caenorhabditis remanei]KAF1767036.1 hypothetical protein GCK72_006994 [Caenorhabditis remanei]
MIWTQQKFEEEREKFEKEKRRIMKVLEEEREKSNELADQLKAATRAIKKLEKKNEELQKENEELEKTILDGLENEDEEEDGTVDFDFDVFVRQPAVRQPVEPKPMAPVTMEKAQPPQKSWFWTKITSLFSGEKATGGIKRSAEIQENEEEDVEPQSKRFRGPEV